MFRYPDGPYNSLTSTRPVSSLSSGSSEGSRPVSGPPSPAAFKLNNYLQMPSWMASQKKEKDPCSMGVEFTFPPQQQHDLLVIQEAAFSNITTTRQAGGKKSPKPDSYNNNYKTVMCQAWLESKICSFAENCRFAHGEAELRPSKVIPKQNSKYKTKLCDKYTTTGLCPYGSRCLFIHPNNDNNGHNNAYIRPDKLVEVSQRHALADMNAQKVSSRPATPEALVDYSNRRSQLRPHPSWPLEPADFFSDKNEYDGPSDLKAYDFQGLFGCFDTPNCVSLTSGYASGESSPLSAISSSSVNLNTSDDEYFERNYFRITGLEHLAEELTRNLTTTELF